MNYQKFARLYSYSRISRYLKASKGNKKKAQQMYYANARLAQAFQPLISFFEVILRNQLWITFRQKLPNRSHHQFIRPRRQAHISKKHEVEVFHFSTFPLLTLRFSVSQMSRMMSLQFCHGEEKLE